MVRPDLQDPLGGHDQFLLGYACDYAAAADTVPRIRKSKLLVPAYNGGVSTADTCAEPLQMTGFIQDFLIALQR